MRNLIALFALIAALTFSSCNSQKAIDKTISLLSSKTWELNTLGGKSLDAKVFADGLPTLNFLQGNRITGNTGCNDLKSTFKLDKKNFSMTPAATTKKACQGGGEAMFLSALSKVKNMKVVGDKLSLLDDKKNELLSFMSK